MQRLVHSMSDARNAHLLESTAFGKQNKAAAHKLLVDILSRLGCAWASAMSRVAAVVLAADNLEVEHTS